MSSILIEGMSITFRDSIVASIPACHAGDRGSIPRRGDTFCEILKKVYDYLHSLSWHEYVYPVVLRVLVCDE